jgi:L-rhamnose mutarotase
METETTFKYEQLDERAKERARDWMRECINQDWEPNYDDIMTCLGGLGFIPHLENYQTVGGKTKQRPMISYSIGYSQSDYAVFSADWEADQIDTARLAEYAPQDETLRQWSAYVMSVMLAHPKASAVVRGREGRAAEIENPRAVPGGDDDPFIENAMHHLVNGLSQWIYEQLRDDLEYQTSDEVIEDTIIANDYDFDEDGGRA